MTNTQKRIASAVVMTAIVAAVCIAGPKYCIGFIALAGVLVIDEIATNFIEIPRTHQHYILGQLSFLAPFIALNFLDSQTNYYTMFINAGILLDIALLAYLFIFRKENIKLFKFINNYSFMVGAYVLIPFMCLAFIFTFTKWLSVLWGLLILNFAMDTGAWFWGKTFGKHKLWPAVSPNKTIEGLVGGMITSACLTSLYWYFSMGSIEISLIVCFLVLAGCSQLGDLVQSKMKRQFEIKDSSNLIPGHGGVYDRLDSLVFVAPLYAMVLIKFYPYSLQ
jgi:phosphatidate cytidylyltransferase